MVDYQSLGDPDQDRQPTKREVRKQEAAIRLRESVERMHYHPVVSGEAAGGWVSHVHDRDEPGHIHEREHRFPLRADGGYLEDLGPSTAKAPPIPDDVLRRVAAILARSGSRAEELVRWKLRLFCGHVVERTAHNSYACADRAFQGVPDCPECGLSPATIIAARPIGPPESPSPRTRTRQA
jgi:hypothetical protein